MKAPLAALALLSPPALAQSVFVAGPAAGPGIDFSGPDAVAQAAAAAGSDDVILVRPGNYDGVSFGFAANGPVRAVFADGDGVTFTRGLAVQPDTVGVLSGFEIRFDALDAPGNPLDSFGVLMSSNPLTPVEDFAWLDELEVRLSNPQPGAGFLGPLNSTNASIVVSGGEFSIDIGQVAALRLSQGSSVFAFDTTFAGGADPFLDQNPLLASAGGGVLAEESQVFLSGSRAIGGTGEAGLPGSGGAPCTDGLTGGPAFVLAESLVPPRLLDSELVGGAGGAAGGPGCSDGPVGASFLDGGVGLTPEVAPVTLPARGLDAPGPIRSGVPTTLRFTGTPGELVWANYAFSVEPTELEGVTGVLIPTVGSLLVSLGAVPASGVLESQVAPVLPAGLEYVLVFGQGVFFSPEDGLVAGTPRPILILGAGL